MIKISLNEFTSGVNTSFSTELNENQATVLRQNGRNTIRQLQDRSVVFSADGGEWAEAYIDSNGRLNSVDTVNTTANYILADKIYIPGFIDEASGDTTHDPDSFTNPSNAFDGDDTTNALKSNLTNVAANLELGKTFSSKYVDSCYIKASSEANDGGHNTECNAYLQTYDGSTWTNVATLYANNPGTGSSSGSYEGGVIVNDTVEGIRVMFDYGSTGDDSNYAYLYLLQYGDADSDTYVQQNIPSGTFSSTVSSCFGTALVADWEEGADIQFKLTNATEDTGWLNYNEISTFTAFTSEPNKCYVKLIPKTTSPTAGYPSIYGFSVVE